MCYFKYFLYYKSIIFSGKALSLTKYSGILMLVPGIFLIGGTFNPYPANVENRVSS
jgi:hypothetical protein